MFFGGGATQMAFGVAVDTSGNIVVSGAFQGTLDFGGSALTNANAADSRAFVAKLDSSGAHVWSKAYGATPSQAGAYGVGVDGTGNIFVAGILQWKYLFRER